MKQFILTTTAQTAHSKTVEHITDLIIGIVIVLAVGIILLQRKRRKNSDNSDI